MGHTPNFLYRNVENRKKWAKISFATLSVKKYKLRYIKYRTASRCKSHNTETTMLLRPYLKPKYEQ